MQFEEKNIVTNTLQIFWRGAEKFFAQPVADKSLYKFL